ncbi:MAG: hypothetical protein COY72_01335 [Candidatus Nealsonbacteria bacterium CG_4_10_14_0_8_um_filter_35_10]|uniref:Uncharacterized protein n=2 Tax=Candidatus Nealsoniibacteriota TaxID=1817911 RepID=A0A2M7R8B9_9BACT|nr:MAG: hypothetical protein AUJ24_01055 [Parcubacteria group bacterium CG1_02_36_42]PIY90842.1 MAG: hypothetical protein COY72_01335 [Candidatus Nealsonbacteria bacterium CG_4_10_14_0_8_um_filter_35_10]PJB99452.1 MAG: hypothetical protein CO077_01680 [Candidatus Nealsonbacteria bacterium CG_4_9_14_0_8_um_filter_35_12]
MKKYSGNTQVSRSPSPELRSGARLSPRFGLALQKPTVSGGRFAPCFPIRENRRVLPTPSPYWVGYP